MKYIDFIGIGGIKCATSWIAQCMKEHPQIFFPYTKELNFFNKRHYYYHDVKNNYYEAKGIKWYKNQFKNAKNKIKGEFTPVYINCPVACKRMKYNFPNVKIIVSLRNPVERAYSEYIHNLRRGVYKNKYTFEEAIKRNPYLLENGLYSKNLKLYLKSFKDVKIIFQDDIKKDSLNIIQDIYNSIGVDSSFIPPSLNKKVNVKGIPRFYLFGRILSWGNHLILKYNFKLITKLMEYTKIFWALNLLREYNMKKSKIPEMNPKTRKELIRYFKKDIEELELLTKRNLKHWKS